MGANTNVQILQILDFAIDNGETDIYSIYARYFYL